MDTPIWSMRNSGGGKLAEIILDALPLFCALSEPAVTYIRAVSVLILPSLTGLLFFFLQLVFPGFEIQFSLNNSWLWSALRPSQSFAVWAGTFHVSPAPIKRSPLCLLGLYFETKCMSVMSYSEFHFLSDLSGGLYGLMAPHPLDILPITLYVFSKEQKYNFSDSMGDDLLLLLFRKNLII